MRRLAVRVLILAAALTTLAVPVFHVAGPPGAGAIPTASACSVGPTCVISSTIPAQIETFVSPITVSATTATFAERATSAQVLGPLTLMGTVGFTVYDLRGNNQGFVASLTSSGFSSSLFPLSAIPASALTVSGKPTVTTTCLGPGPVCGPGLGVTSTVDLSMVPPVAVECPVEALGEGAYAVSVPLLLTIPNGPPGFQAEKFASYPASWFGTFTVGVMEGQPVSSFAAFGCPPFSVTPVAPTATPSCPCVTPTAIVTPTATPPPAPTATAPAAPTATPPPAPTATAPPAATATPPPAPTATAAVYTVAMVAGNKFSPATLTVPRGSTVTWMNQDTMHHTTTSNAGDPESWDSGDMAPGATFSHTFMTPGTYGYHCTYHQALGMVGTVTVQ